MGQVITVDFQAKRVMISREAWLDGARRCSAEAERQPEEIARTLRRCSDHYLRLSLIHI